MRGAQLEPHPSPCSDVSVTFKPGIQTRLLPNSWQFNIISSSSSPLTISYAKNSVNKFWWGLDVLNLRRRVFSLIKRQDTRRKKVMSWQLVFMFGARLSIKAGSRTETLSKLNYKTVHHHSLSHNICTICIKNNFLETILAKTWTRVLKTIRNCAEKSRNLGVDGFTLNILNYLPAAHIWELLTHLNMPENCHWTITFFTFPRNYWFFMLFWIWKEEFLDIGDSKERRWRCSDEDQTQTGKWLSCCLYCPQ